jgi:uncharacterized protein YecE (DUF72 family)
MALETVHEYPPQTATGKILVGTSGWSYRHWRGIFYPERLAGNAALAYYAARFATVEVNRTFYSLPETATIERWRDTARPGFSFAVKAPRQITHMKRLRRSEAALADFLTRVRGLGHTLGPILFQLPDGFPRDTGLLRNFLDMLPRDLAYAFEFRDQTWFRDRIYDLLADREAAFCIYHLGDRETPRVVTAPFVYLRLHGLGTAYAGAYGREELQRWAAACCSWAADEFDVRVYFNNDLGGSAVRDAVTLRNLVGQRVAWGLPREREPGADESNGRLVG